MKPFESELPLINFQSFVIVGGEGRGGGCKDGILFLIKLKVCYDIARKRLLSEMN